MPTPPDEIQALARQRADARAHRDWTTADQLRGQIEAAGWRVIDRGLEVRLVPAHPPDRHEGDRTLYGSSQSVPSALDQPPTLAASIVVVVTDEVDAVDRITTSPHLMAPEHQLVIVANDPSPELEARLEQWELTRSSESQAAPAEEQAGTGVEKGPGGEVVWTALRMGHAAALNSGLRRARGEILITIDPGFEPTGAFVGSLIDALQDEQVAITGAVGVETSDLRRYRETSPGQVAAVTSACQAFRRADFIERGPLDERFRDSFGLDWWWSLVLRDEGLDRPSRIAVSLDLPARRRPLSESPQPVPMELDRARRRNRYRIIDRFGHRRDLASG